VDLAFADAGPDGIERRPHGQAGAPRALADDRLLVGVFMARWAKIVSSADTIVASGSASHIFRYSSTER
jgi:hypothetical protein